MSGFQSPNHTQIPNDLFDLYLPDLGYAELKILLAILRQTLGFHRRKKRLSFTDLEKITGLSRSTLHTGCKKLVKTGLVDRIKDGGVTLWVVHWKDQNEDDPPHMGVLGVSETDIPEIDTVSKTDTDHRGKRHAPVSKTATPSIKETIKERQSNKDKDSRSNNERNEMIEAVLEVCNLSWDTFRQNGKMRGLINRTAKIILQRELTPDNIRQFYGKGGWWWTDHWIGKDKNSAPRPEQIADTLDQAIDSDQNSEVHRQEFAEGWENR